MRDIKFRAWDERYGKMVYPDGNGYFSSIYRPCFVIDGNGEAINLDNKETPDNIVLMQYTGLKDKDGIEIYEGDIVKGSISNIRKSEVFFAYGQFHPFAYLGGICGVHYKVIGNKFENPELLDKEQE